VKRFLIMSGLTALFVGAVLLTLFAKTTTANADIAAGNQAYTAQDYATALQRYTAAQAQAPAQVEPAYNAANTYYRQHELEKARQTLEPTLALPQTALAEFVHFNLGNIAYNAQQFDIAIAQYEDALRLQPGDVDAKYNLELALQQKQQQEQQQQNQQQQNQDQQNQQQNQDQQNQDQQNQDQQQNQSDQQDQQNGQQGDQQQQDQQQGDQQQPGQQQGDQQDGQAVEARQPAGLTPEQAKRLLAVIGGNGKTLMEKLQWMYVTPGGNPDKDW
jgi:hypothetical protein